MSKECDKLFEKDIQEYLKFYKNDKDKLNEIIIKHEKLFYSIYHKFSHYANGIDKEDCMQIIYLKFLECIEKYNSESESYFFSYFYAAVTNTFLMRGRYFLKNKKYCTFLEYLDEPIPDTEKTITKGETLLVEENGYELCETKLMIDNISRVINSKSFTDRDRESFQMLLEMYYDGRTQENIALEYGVSQSIISRRISRLIEKIKKKIS